MKDAFFLFDKEGNCIQVNESGKEYLDKKEEKYSAFQYSLNEWFGQRELNNCDNFTKDFTEIMDGETKYFQIIFQRLEDDVKGFFGSFLILRNRTEEMNKLYKERFLATHDRLTGLYNKEYFYERVHRKLQRHSHEEYLMVCSDVKHFKMVNDMFGKQAGDKLLLRIADSMRVHGNDSMIYGRLVNDRFAILMPKRCFNHQAFEQEPEKIVNRDLNLPYAIRVKIGVYEIKDKNMPVDAMCDRALMAIAEIKENSQKTVGYYGEQLRDNLLKEQELSGSLERAIRKGQIQIYLQPQVDKHEKVYGGEALVRWIHPERGIVPPGDFIGVFERNGMIATLDKYVWELACKQLQKWSRRGKNNMYISINISPKDFYFMDVCQVLKELVKKYQVHPGSLKVEITETAVMQNLKEQLTIIRNLRDAGFTVEMDDFGSGYSSLNMLKNIRVDVLKIDMGFLGTTTEETRGRKILKMVIQLSKELGMPIVMEGVETREQVEFLKSLDCDMFQGYYFAKPMPVDEFEAKYL
ncbi:MAG: bifunctional diguanylate cyclase/phosphodiesterase [Lachnospiraceae bacterium]|nr:bifunctional diguanylate cyclase/phosphodiesterase [Lachnospiraceae bacterium]